MPNFLVNYERDGDRFTVGVVAKTAINAIEQVATKHPDADIHSVSNKGVFLVPTNEPTWVRRDGGIQRISTMEPGNLKAIRKTLLAGGEAVKATGLFAAIESAIADSSTRSLA